MILGTQAQPQGLWKWTRSLARLIRRARLELLPPWRKKRIKRPRRIGQSDLFALLMLHAPLHAFSVSCSPESYTQLCLRSLLFLL